MVSVIDNDSDWMIDDTNRLDQPVAPERRPWKVVIIDDEPDIHSLTDLALRGMTFHGRPLGLLSAYSADEGFALLRDNPDTAIVLLDVVMETDDAGLRLACRIREELGNRLVRIILRTGQPGHAPEEKVIVDYDINDYKYKTELTARKLFVTVTAALRTFEGLQVIEMSRQGLRQILNGAENLYQNSSLREFSSGVLSQISAILSVGADGMLCVKRTGATLVNGVEIEVVAGTGKFAEYPQRGVLGPCSEYYPLVRKAFELGSNHYEHPHDFLHFSSQNGYRFVIVFTPPWPLEDFQKDLLGIFCDRMAAAFDNLYLYEQLHASNEATVIALADLAEQRDVSTGNHLLRVKRLTEAVVARLQQIGAFPGEINDVFRTLIGTASILHDVGKVTTPDNVLLKPGRLNDAERIIMQGHARAGEEILERAAKLINGESYLSVGAQIAGGHHECVDGSGYPRGLRENEIPLAARIVAVIDVFDALVHRRLYKEPWPVTTALDYLRAGAGTRFDTVILAAFLAVVEENPEAWVDPQEL